MKSWSYLRVAKWCLLIAAFLAVWLIIALSSGCRVDVGPAPWTPEKLKAGPDRVLSVGEKTLIVQEGYLRKLYDRWKKLYGADEARNRVLGIVKETKMDGTWVIKRIE